MCRCRAPATGRCATPPRAGRPNENDNKDDEGGEAEGGKTKWKKEGGEDEGVKLLF